MTVEVETTDVPLLMLAGYVDTLLRMVTEEKSELVGFVQARMIVLAEAEEMKSEGAEGAVLSTVTEILEVA